MYIARIDHASLGWAVEEVFSYPVALYLRKNPLVAFIVEQYDKLGGGASCLIVFNKDEEKILQQEGIMLKAKAPGAVGFVDSIVLPELRHYHGGTFEIQWTIKGDPFPESRLAVYVEKPMLGIPRALICEIVQEITSGDLSKKLLIGLAASKDNIRGFELGTFLVNNSEPKDDEIIKRIAEEVSRRMCEMI